jgi:hypothetical protein
MCRSEWDSQDRAEESKGDLAWPRFGDDSADQFGLRTALFVLAVACFIGAVWFMSRPWQYLLDMSLKSRVSPRA